MSEVGKKPREHADSVPWTRRSAANQSQPQTAARHLLIKGDGRTHCVPISQIDWCEADGNYVQLHVGSRTLHIRRTMAEVSTRLGPPFVRISRTTIVNVDRILEIRSTGTGEHLVVLRGGESRRLTKGYRQEFMNKFLVL
jgi:two-component system LytT family response regulator